LNSVRPFLSFLPLLVLGTPALGQSLSDPALEESDELQRSGAANEILVVATRFGGELDLPQEPVATFDEADIQALGATSVADLLSAIAPQTGSGRGRGGGQPVVLVNGQRITNFREMRNYPPEAIKKVEVLPEEAALRLGYPADARVVNMILKDNYANRRVEFDYGFPTRGGFAEWEGEATVLRIAGPNRFSLTATAEDRSPLFEAERGLVQTPGTIPSLEGDPDPAEFRSLIADSRSFVLNAGWTRGLGKGGIDGSLSLSANLSRNDSHSYSGLNTVQPLDPLDQVSRTTTLQGGAGLNKVLGKWQLSATLDATHGLTHSLTDRRGELAGQDRARSQSLRLEGLATLIGQPFRLPAGAAALTLKSGFTRIGFESSDQRSTAGPVTLRRFRALAGLNLALPLTSRREQVLPGIGDLTLNLGGDWSHLSDFGAVNGWSAGFTWSPWERLSLQASYIVNQAAPTISQLGSPEIVTQNVPVFDYTRGETALVAVPQGGNPALLKEEQRDWKLGATWQAPFLPNATLVAEYFRNRSDNVTAGFPLLTPEIEAAFPGRATRDGSGRLIALDTRWVTFAEQSASRMRWGMNLSGTIGKAPAGGGPGGGLGGPRPFPSGAGGPGGSRPPGAGGGGGGGMGRMMAMMGGGNQGRWSLGAYHSVQFTSRVLIAPGGPALDLLGGDALSTSGTPRHSLEFNGGLFRQGKGMFLSGTWSAPTRIEANGLPGSSDLRFGALTRIGANFFVELGDQGKLAERLPFFKGLRLALRFENLLDSRQKVTDASGAVPLSYQRDYLDPRGRVIEIDLRKMF
jgi:hypothetical protein